MPRPKTGKPVGRPATYATPEEKPVTRSLRIPRDLDARLERYASLHRQSVTELLLDGLRWRIGEEGYYGNTEISSSGMDEPGEAAVLQEIRTALASQAAQLQTLTQALEPRPRISPPETYYSNTTKEPAAPQSTPEPKDAGSNTVLPENSKAAILVRLQAMKAQGMSLAKIAAQLQAEGLPTLSGKGSWQKGTVDGLLRGR